MFIGNTLSIIKMSEELNYENDINKLKICGYIDAFSMLNLVRAQYESYCNFNNIYIQNSSIDERDLKYKIWVLAGLNNRQKFDALTQENIVKKEEERIEILNIISEIQNNIIYQSLVGGEKNKITSVSSENKWRLTIKNNEPKLASWSQLLKNAGINNFDTHYRYLSLCTHPSHVSTYQFRDMHLNNNVKRHAIHALLLSELFLSFFIVDFLKYYTKTKIVFEELPELNRFLIYSNNKAFRPQIVL